MGFKRLLGNKGSILFIVLISMSVMITLAASLLFSVHNEMDIIYDDIENEQAYQTALAVNDWVFDYLYIYMTTVNDASEMEDQCPLAHEIWEMEAGDPAISAADFIAGGVPGEEDYFGRYEIEIIFDPINSGEAGDVEYVSFDIVSTVFYESTGGAEREYSFTRGCTLSRTKLVPAVPGQPPTPAGEYYEYEISMGGGDFSLGLTTKVVGAAIETPVYYGNGTVELSQPDIRANIAVFGNLEIANQGGATANNAANRVEINVGGNFKMNETGLTFPKGATIRVGGNFEYQHPFGSSNASDEKIIIYVLGDFTSKSDWANFSNVVVFVDGNARIGGSYNTTGVTYFVNGNVTLSGGQYGMVYYSGTLSGSSSGMTAYKVDSAFWAARGISGNAEPWPETQAELDSLLSTGIYPAVSGVSFEAKANAYTNLMESVGTQKLDAAGDPVTGANGRIEYIPVEVPVWDPVQNLEDVLTDPASTAAEISAAQGLLDDLNTNEIDLSAMDATVGGKGLKIITQSGYTTGRQPYLSTVVIDTTNGSSNPDDHSDIYIKLCANSGSTFMWTEDWDGREVNVVVRGAGSVIFVVDTGVRYVASNREFIGHEGWLRYLGGSSSAVEWGASGYYAYGSLYSVVNTSLASGLIHGSDFCTETYCAYCTGADLTKAPVGKHLIRQDSTVDLIDTARGNNPYFIHNNIFIVDMNTGANGNHLQSASTYTAFVYAPFSNLKPQNTTVTINLLGGIIVASMDVTWGSSLKIAHCMPADYYPFNRYIMSQLIGSSLPGNSSSGTPGTPETPPKPADFLTNGYS